MQRRSDYAQGNLHVAKNKLIVYYGRNLKVDAVTISKVSSLKTKNTPQNSRKQIWNVKNMGEIPLVEWFTGKRVLS